MKEKILNFANQHKNIYITTDFEHRKGGVLKNLSMSCTNSMLK